MIAGILNEESKTRSQYPDEFGFSFDNDIGLLYNNHIKWRGKEDNEMSMNDIDRIISEVNGSMTIEGMPLTDEDKERIFLLLSNQKPYDIALQELIVKHSA